MHGVMVDFEALGNIWGMWCAMWFILSGFHWLFRTVAPEGVPMWPFIPLASIFVSRVASGLTEMEEAGIMTVTQYEKFCCNLLFAGCGVWLSL